MSAAPRWTAPPLAVPIGPAGHVAAWWGRVDRAHRVADRDALAVLDLALTQGLVVTHAQARAVGLAQCDLRSLVRRGRWSVPRRGVLCPLPPDDGGQTHEIAATAAALSRRNTVIGFASAMALHGLPLLTAVGPPTLTAGRAHDAVSYDHVRVHVAALRRAEVCRWFGTEVTSVARTVVDVCRARGVPDGLVAADAALHATVTTVPLLEQAARRQIGWPGSCATTRILRLADGRAESPLESLVRLCLDDGDLPMPTLQAWVTTDAGAYRVDMLYEHRRVIVEADGLLKYRDDPASLVAEKIRQEHLERAGYRVVRVLWNDVARQPDQVVARVRRALTDP